jgi:hypothetical protein
MRKLRTRILVGGAVAVFAAATAFAVTNTAVGTTAVKTEALTTTSAATAKTGTTLSVTAAQLVIRAGQQDSISGTLLASGSPAGAKVVELYRFNDKLRTWRPLRIKVTSTAGAVTFKVRPGITRQYELVYHGNTALTASTSGTVTVTVTPGTKRVTALSVSATPAGVTAGQATRITGVLTTGTTPLVHRVVSLYRYDATAGTWVRVAVELTGSKGGVTFTRKPTATTTFGLAFHGGPALTAVHSGKVTVTVTG